MEREIQALYKSLEDECPYDKALDVVTRALCHVVSLSSSFRGSGRGSGVLIDQPYHTSDMAHSLQAMVGHIITLLHMDQHQPAPPDISVSLSGGTTVVTTQEVTVPYKMKNDYEIQMSIAIHTEIMDEILRWLPCSSVEPSMLYPVCDPIIEDIIRNFVDLPLGTWGVAQTWWAKRGGDASMNAVDVDIYSSTGAGAGAPRGRGRDRNRGDDEEDADEQAYKTGGHAWTEWVLDR